MRPVADLAGVRDAHRRLIDSLRFLTEDVIRRPSLLTGWSVGHVLAHIARNADSHTHMTEGATRGEVALQYPGGAEQRERDIELGAALSRSDLIADVTEACARLERAWSEASESVWASGKACRLAGESWIRELPFFRWREVEIHHHDLGIGFSFRDWPDAYVYAEIERMIAGLGARLDDTGIALRSTDSQDVWTVPDNSCSVVEVRAPRRQLLAWLVGRYDDPYYPRLKPW